MIWVVTANTNQCRIYHFDKHPEKITLLKEINHPENKLKKEDVYTDRSGRYQSFSSGGSTYSPPSDPKEVEIDHFSREIAHLLNQGRNTAAYKKLIIITPAHMDGLLSRHLDKHVKELVANKIQKDVMRLAPHELLEFLKTHRW